MPPTEKQQKYSASSMNASPKKPDSQHSTIKEPEQKIAVLKKQYYKLIKSDRFIDLTLTYDFEEEQPVIKNKKKRKELSLSKA